MMTLLHRSLLALALLGSAVSALGDGAFLKANQLYEEQKYGEAKREYESLLKPDADAVHTAVLYNLGNTEYRLGSPGRAILNYQRALALEPRFVEARENLAVVRSETGAQLLTPSVFDRLVPPVSEPVLSIALAVGGWVFIFAFAAIVFLRKSQSAAAWLALLAGGLIAAWSGVALWRTAEAGAVAIVLEQSANARTEPADRAAVVEPLAAGSEVRVLGEHGEWSYCELPGAQRGWLATRALEHLRQPPGS